MGKPESVEMPDHGFDDVEDLPSGTKLLGGQYTVTRYLNSGGFGITYLATDSLNRDVVIKECFPGAFCCREGNMVQPRSRAHLKELQSVVRLFIKEAHSLAKLTHPHIVGVHQVFEDNGTAYMAIDYIRGRDLLALIEEDKVRLEPRVIVGMTEKLLSAVGFIHDHGMLHRDISPDNVLLKASGDPILIDFGAAREQATRASRVLTTLRVVKDGYSPQEFYIAGSEQGPWSDLYALGATLYHLISGAPPVSGQVRLAALAENRGDPNPPLTGRFAGYPRGFLEAIDKAMSPTPKHRTQSAAEWYDMFRGQPVDVATAAALKPAPTRSERDMAEAVAALVEEHSRLIVPEEPAQKDEAELQAEAELERLRKKMKVQAWAMELAGDPEEGHATQGLPAITEAGSDTYAPGTARQGSRLAIVLSVCASLVVAGLVLATLKGFGGYDPYSAAGKAAADEQNLAAQASEGQAARHVDEASWTLDLPFETKPALLGEKPVLRVTSVDENAGLSATAPWIAKGVLIEAVNAVPVAADASLSDLLLTNPVIDPTGHMQVAILYRPSEGSPAVTGTLGLQTKRTVTLQNDMGFSVQYVGDAWRTVVTSVPRKKRDGLKVGDILYRDKTTGSSIDTAYAFEDLVAALERQKATETVFSVYRGADMVAATMPIPEIKGGSE